MRSIPFYPLMVVLLVGLGGYLGCDPNNIEIPNGLAPTANIEKETASGSFLNAPANAGVNASIIPARTTSTIIVGSFNMQRLGPSKLADPWVMERFAEIIRQYDVIALQEITSKDQRTLPILVQEINRNGGRYSYTIAVNHNISTARLIMIGYQWRIPHGCRNRDFGRCVLRRRIFWSP